MTGKVAGVNPEAWKIIKNKLYLSWDMKGANRFEKKADALVSKGDKNWVNLIK